MVPNIRVSIFLIWSSTRPQFEEKCRRCRITAILKPRRVKCIPRAARGTAGAENDGERSLAGVAVKIPRNLTRSLSNATNFGRNCLFVEGRFRV